MEEETGKDRLRALFKRRYRHWYKACVTYSAAGRPGDDVVLEEVREFQVTVLVCTLTGFLLGGLVGARYAGDKFVAISHSAKFSSTMQAQVSACTDMIESIHVLGDGASDRCVCVWWRIILKLLRPALDMYV